MQIKQEIKQIMIVSIGSMILAFGMFNIHAQSNITEGGILGLLLFFKHWFNLSPSISTLILDGTCYLLGLYFFGKRFLLKSLYATISFAFFYAIFEKIGPISFLQFDNYLLNAIFGGIFVGIGVGIVVGQHVACGGDDALALVIKHLTHLKIKYAYMFTDFTVLMLSLSYIALENIIYSLISVLISSTIIDLFQKN